jgi:hypothetical protein
MSEFRPKRGLSLVVRCPENGTNLVSLLTEKSISLYLIERIKSEMVMVYE